MLKTSSRIPRGSLSLWTTHPNSWREPQLPSPADVVWSVLPSGAASGSSSLSCFLYPRWWEVPAFDQCRGTAVAVCFYSSVPVAQSEIRSLQFEGGSTLACTLHEYCPRRSILTTFVACVQLAGMRTPLQKLSTCRIKTCVVVSSIQAKDPLCRVLCTYRLWVLDHDGNPHTFCYSFTIWSQIVQERLIQHNYIYKPLCVALLVHSVLEVERGSLPVLFTYDCVL